MRSLGSILVVVLICVVGLTSPALAEDVMYWDAYAEDGDVIMLGTYSETFDGEGTVDQKFEVKVWNAPPNRRLDVAINGHVIGVLITNANGFGKFEKEKFGVPLDDSGRPDGPRIDAGDFLTVGKRGGNSIGAEFMPR